MEWCFKIESAPKGEYKKYVSELNGKIKERTVYIGKKLLTASKCGQVFVSEILENGRWHGYGEKEKPVAWAHLLSFPENWEIKE